MSLSAYVGNLPYSVDENSLGQHFEGCQVSNVRIPTDRETGRPKGFAFVEFADEQSLRKAIDQYNGSDCGGRQIRVNEAQGSGGERGGGRGEEEDVSVVEEEVTVEMAEAEVDLVVEVDSETKEAVDLVVVAIKVGADLAVAVVAIIDE